MFGQRPTISSIRNSYSNAKEELEQLEKFILEYRDDERAGVKKIVDSATKQAQSILKEKKRVRGLYEYECEIAGSDYFVGMDEVGRGPLAGPLCIGAVCLPHEEETYILGIDDSKKLSSSKREELAARIKENAIAWDVQFIFPEEIDEIGMGKSLRKAFSRAIISIDRQLEKLGLQCEKVLLDGNPLHLDEREVNIVKGDAKCASISCASIIAKVTRDKLMEKFALEYPQYGWENNSGYGTPGHIAAIRQYGLTPHHRKSFCKNFTPF